jgi:hypothetical protein
VLTRDKGVGVIGEVLGILAGEVFLELVVCL